MDTKWKNNTIFLIYSLMLTIGLNGLLLSLDQGSRYLHRDYFKTPEFREQLDQFASYLNLFELNSLSEEEAKSFITVDEDDIVNYRNQLSPLAEQMNWIRDEYEPIIQEAAAANNDKLADYYEAQKEDKLEDILTLFKDDESVIRLIRKEKEHRVEGYYRQREMYRSNFNHLRNQFDYYLRNPSSGIIHSSLNVSDDKDAKNEMYGSGHLYATDYTIDILNSIHYTFDANDFLENSIIPYQGWISVPKGSPLQEEARKYRWEQWILLAYSLTSILLLVVCLTRFKGVLSNRAETSLWKDYHRKLPLDIKIILLSGTAALAIVLLINISGQYPVITEASLFYSGKLLITLTFAVLAVAMTLLQGRFLANELRSWSNLRSEWKHSLLFRGFLRLKAGFVQAINLVKDSFIYKSTGIRLIVLTSLLIGLGYFGAWASLPYFQYNDNSFVLYAPILVIVGSALFLQFARQLGYLNRVAEAANELADGRIPNELIQSGNGVLSSLASNINALRSGVKMMQNEQAKSERLKTELITNVSHDLRTPLTSIITYAGLLKSTEATTEERAAYIEIINQKSKRLKTMIDDLFEVSTMASGNTKLLLEKSDLVQLMQQAIAEYKEVMDASDIQFRISLLKEPLFLHVDGQKLWRAFDNLIGNMLKYSLNHTRAYISMQLSEHREVTIAFKNVSKYEISDNAEDLFERFKRGDTSRHTEGSGLGLAIAKSIIELHNGRLALETDGDLFKASVTLKL